MPDPLEALRDAARVMEAWASTIERHEGRSRRDDLEALRHRQQYYERAAAELEKERHQ